jgi:hypothetical protein
VKRLNPIQLAAVKRAARCPDCDSTVLVDASTDPPQTSVYHDDDCPQRTAFARTSRPSTLGLFQNDATTDLLQPRMPTVDWDAIHANRLAAQAAEHDRRQEQKRATRADHQAARTAGLRIRHATKLARITQSNTETLATQGDPGDTQEA